MVCYLLAYGWNLFATIFWGCLNLYWRRWWHPTPVLLPGKSHGWRRLVSCSPWGHKDSDTTEQLHFDFSLSCLGEGNGSPLQYSCLDNPRNRGPWWAAVYGVAQGRTRLKWLSSSSSKYLKGVAFVLLSKENWELYFFFFFFYFIF